MVRTFVLGVALVAGPVLADSLCSTVGRVSVSPVVDGERDAVYAEAFPLEGFTYPDRMDVAEEQTRLWLVHDGTSLYGFAACRQPDTVKLPPLQKFRRDGGAWKGNSVELFFRTESGMRYYVVNASGLAHWMSAMQNEALQWNQDESAPSAMKAVVKQKKGGWTAEFAIPLAEIPGESWRFAVVRNVADGLSSVWQRQEGSSVWQLTAKEMGRLLLSKEPLGNLVFARLPPFGREGPFAYAVTNAAGRVLYRYECRKPEPFVRISPYNLLKGELPIGVGSKVPSALIWNCRHNYRPEPGKPDGAVRMPLTIRLKVPDGIVVTSGRKTGTVVENGTRWTAYEQTQPSAFNAPGWFQTRFGGSLPHGSRGVIRYSLDFPDGRMPEREVAFRIVEIPEVTPPRRFLAGHFNLYVSSVDEARAYARGGVNTFGVRESDAASARLARDLTAAGFQVIRGYYFWPGSSDSDGKWNRWTKEDESARALDIDGKPIATGRGLQLSPSYRGRCFQEAVRHEADFIRASGVSFWEFDMEDDVHKKGEKGDFSPATLAAFRDYWLERHPGAASAPDPRTFERDPAAHPEEHRAWVDVKCRLWGRFFRDLKDGVERLSGVRPTMSEWSFGNFGTLEGRNHCLRGADFFREFDYIEIPMYSGPDRMLRGMTMEERRFREAFPGERMPKVIYTPSPVRLGEGPGSYFHTTAPELDDETYNLFKEAITKGAQGMMTFTISQSNADYARQFARGVALLNKVEDLVLDGSSFDLTCDRPADAVIADAFGGKMTELKNQPRVFVRGRTLGGKTVVSVSEYRELKPMTVRVNYAFHKRTRAVDLETGAAMGTFEPGKRAIPVSLSNDCRCRLVLLEELD